MAAVICGSIGNLCSNCGNLCSGCGDLLCLPCKACGIGCSTLCEAIASPFFPYLFVTFSLNFATAVLGMQSIPDLGNGCFSEAQWMLISGIFSIAHMIASLYIVHKIREDTIEDSGFVQVQNNNQPAAAAVPMAAVVTGYSESDKMESGTNYKQMKDAPSSSSTSAYDKKMKDEASKSGGYNKKDAPIQAEVIHAEVVPTKGATTTTTTTHTIPPPQQWNERSQGDGMSWSRMKQVLCYDKGVAVYIVIAVIWIFWQARGVAKWFEHDIENCGHVGSRMLTSLFCGWLYMALVGVAFLCSMCCMRL